MKKTELQSAVFKVIAQQTPRVVNIDMALYDQGFSNRDIAELEAKISESIGYNLKPLFSRINNHRCIESANTLVNKIWDYIIDNR